MAVQTTESQTLTLDSVFLDHYIVPDYQRGFVWEHREVQRLLDDILRQYSATQDPDNEYFIGASVVTPAINGGYEVIDGQQRLATMFLFFAAIRDYLRRLGAKPIEDIDEKLLGWVVDPAGNRMQRHRVVLGFEDSTTLLQKIAQDGAHIDDIKATTRSIENIVSAYKTHGEFLDANFGRDLEAIRQFYGFVTGHVKTVRIRTGTVTRALQMFETVNHRGVSLESMDLLKNLLFMYAAREQYPILRNRWKELVDKLYVSAKMEKGYQRDRQYRFMMYFLRSTYKVQDMKEDAMYDWFLKNEYQCHYKTQPLEFMDKMLDAATSSYYRAGAGG